MSNRFRTPEGDISAVSNELEFHLHDVDAAAVIDAPSTSLEMSHEVNRHDFVELMVSMAPDVEQLNQWAGAHIAQLAQLVSQLDGMMYSGGSLLSDVSDREPTWYRTTSLSEQLARGFLDMGSQQMVIGIARAGDKSGEAFGMQLYNFLRQLTPVILAMSAASPYRYQDGQLVDTGAQSRRPAQYQAMSARLPRQMFATPPLHSLDEYQAFRQSISDQVNQALERGELDANYSQLYADRANGPYAPFTLLEPHQMYSWVRIRPDHANEDALFSLEVRAADLPIRVEMIQTLNSFIGGLSYYAADQGFDELQTAVAPLGLVDQDIRGVLLNAAKSGLDARIGAQHRSLRIRNLLLPLGRLALSGLRHRNLPTQQLENQLQRLLTQGTDAEEIRAFHAQSSEAEALRGFLQKALVGSLVESGGR